MEFIKFNIMSRLTLKSESLVIVISGNWEQETGLLLQVYCSVLKWYVIKNENKITSRRKTKKNPKTSSLQMISHWFTFH